MNDKNERMEILVDLLPHGSGIDCKWEVSRPKNGRFVYFHNSYHAMNENGYYEGYQDFSVVIPAVIVDLFLSHGRYISKKHAARDLQVMADTFKLEFNGDRYLSEKHYLRDYLTDEIYHSLYFAQAEDLS